MLARAWLGTTRVPGLTGTRDERDKRIAPLGPEADRAAAPAIRADVLVDRAAEDLYPTWQKNLEEWKRTGGDHAYHYLGSAIWFHRIGAAMGGAMLDLLKARK